MYTRKEIANEVNNNLSNVMKRLKASGINLAGTVPSEIIETLYKMNVFGKDISAIIPIQSTDIMTEITDKISKLIDSDYKNILDRMYNAGYNVAGYSPVTLTKYLLGLALTKNNLLYSFIPSFDDSGKNREELNPDNFPSAEEDKSIMAMISEHENEIIIATLILLIFLLLINID